MPGIFAVLFRRSGSSLRGGGNQILFSFLLYPPRLSHLLAIRNEENARRSLWTKIVKVFDGNYCTHISFIMLCIFSTFDACNFEKDMGFFWKLAKLRLCFKFRNGSFSISNGDVFLIQTERGGNEISETTILSKYIRGNENQILRKKQIGVWERNARWTFGVYSWIYGDVWKRKWPSRRGRAPDRPSFLESNFLLHKWKFLIVYPKKFLFKSGWRGEEVFASWAGISPGIYFLLFFR